MAAALVVGVWFAGGVRASAPESPRPLRVLVVGNSYTRFNLLHRLLEHVANSVPFGTRLRVDAEARNGYSLRMHLQAGLALARIRGGHYDYVVLQDHSLRAVDHPSEMAEDAARFTRAIEASGARAVLYETWPRHPDARLYRKHPWLHSYEQMAGRIDATYNGLAQKLRVTLAPIGSAFERGLGTEPSLALVGPDGSHPTIAGSFLAACVLYGSILSADPRATGYAPPFMAEERASALKELAHEALAERARQLANEEKPAAAPAAPAPQPQQPSPGNGRPDAISSTTLRPSPEPTGDSQPEQAAAACDSGAVPECSPELERPAAAPPSVAVPEPVPAP